MSIENRILKAYEHFFEDDIENALIQISIAIDAYAKKKYDIKKVGERIKKFLKKNAEVIAIIGTWGFSRAPSMVFPGGNLESILYKSVRCSLLHEAKLAEQIKFIKGNTFIIVSDKLELNQDFVLGIIISVIVDDETKYLKLDKIKDFVFKEHTISISKIHGNRDELFNQISLANKT